MRTFQPLDRVRRKETDVIYVVRRVFGDGYLSLQSLHGGRLAQLHSDSLELVAPAPDMAVAKNFIAQAEMLVARIRRSRQLDTWQKDWLRRELEKVLGKIDG